jgi:archaellum component FlaF (FlaF/FlaG flagellin family)
MLNKNTLERKDTLKLNSSNSNLSTSSNLPPTSPFKMIYIAIIIIILLLVALLIFYKDEFIKLFNRVFNSDTNINANTKLDDTSSKVDNTSAKVDTASAKVDVTSAKVESTSAKIDELDKKVNTLIESKTCSNKSDTTSGNGGINKLNTKLNDSSPYNKKTLTTDGYCYLGYDNGQRECMEAYAGDVCMSGEIFPSLDICINPKLRA